jgi:hypothetical protein
MFRFWASGFVTMEIFDVEIILVLALSPDAKSDRDNQVFRLKIYEWVEIKKRQKML